MAMNGKRDAFDINDFKACARVASLKRGRAAAILDEVRTIVSHWSAYADASGVPTTQRNKIQKTLRLE